MEGVRGELQETAKQAGVPTLQAFEEMLDRRGAFAPHAAADAGGAGAGGGDMGLRDVQRHRWTHDGRSRALPEGYRLPSDGGLEAVFKDWFLANAARGAPPLRVLHRDDLWPWTTHRHEAIAERAACQLCEWNRCRKDFSTLKAMMADVESRYVAAGRRGEGLRGAEVDAAWREVKAEVEERLLQAGSRRIGELSWRTIALKHWRASSGKGKDDAPAERSARCAAAGRAPRGVAPVKKRRREQDGGGHAPQAPPMKEPRTASHARAGAGAGLGLGGLGAGPGLGGLGGSGM